MRVGLDRFAEEAALRAPLAGHRVGLVAHPASVDRGLVHAARVLAAHGVRPAVFFGPEHGYGGEAQDMVGVRGAVDAATGAPIISLYGDTFAELSPTAEDLARVDTIVVDLADVGARYYTFVWTAWLVVQAAAARGVRTLILDRPNPLGDDLSTVEGPRQAPGFTSFVGLEPIAIRHGLTLGAIVAACAARRGLPLGRDGALAVAAVEDLAPGALAPAWDRPFVLPSPNMPTFETALVYPGGCLVEGTNLSEGRGTTRPFEIVGAPFLDGARLAADLAATGLPGFVARPLTFFPMFQKHARTTCGGVQIHVTDARAFRPVRVYAALLALARAQAPEAFRFRTERYEYVDDVPAIDLLTGSTAYREGVLAGVPARDLAEALGRPDPDHADVAAQARAALARARV